MNDSFAKKLLSWHLKHKRQLPWKKEKDAYKIWVSEIILQQTRVEQGTPYYLKFLDAYPTLEALAASTEDQLMSVWQGLGYYSRARNMLHTAKHIVQDLGGEFPDTYNELIKLKGVGPYTAAAISSFAFDEAQAVVDGNVIRVISRYQGIDLPFNNAKGKKLFAETAQSMMDISRPAAYNQAIMDFGALQCKPGIPDCTACPMNEQCKAFLNNSVQYFPVKSKRLQKKDRYFNYFIIQLSSGQYLINKQIKKDIWKGLYEFPKHESASGRLLNIEKEVGGILKDLAYDAKFHAEFLSEGKQTLTHQIINARFYKVNLESSEIELPPDFYLVDIENLCNFAFPKLIDWFIDEKIIPL